MILVFQTQQQAERCLGEVNAALIQSGVLSLDTVQWDTLKVSPNGITYFADPRFHPLFGGEVGGVDFSAAVSRAFPPEWAQNDV